MIRVAAHKLGSISSSPQSATVLTILTQPTELQRLLHSLQLFHWLSNWHLFTWLLIHSIFQPTQLTQTNTHTPKCPPTSFRRSKACGMHGLLSHTCNLLTEDMKDYRNPVRGENEVCVGFTRLFLGAGKWGDHGVLVMRLSESTQSPSVSFWQIWVCSFSTSPVKVFTC